MSISNVEHGKFNSNFVSTSGCKIPILPITLLLYITSAYLFGKKVGSVRRHYMKIFLDRSTLNALNYKTKKKE